MTFHFHLQQTSAQLRRQYEAQIAEERREHQQVVQTIIENKQREMEFSVLYVRI